MANIKFGTDGWRAITDKDFTCDNVKRVTIAIGKYIFDNFGMHKKILVGYDPRNKADELSLLCANILAELGFTVLYSDKVIPTPVLAYNARVLNACAIMFTASHNPPEYLGMKFIPDYAGPATNDITDEILSNLDKDFEPKIKGDVKKYDFSKDYFEHIEKLIDFEKIRNFGKTIIFDGLYSATIGYFDKLLSNNGVKYNSIHMWHDTNFGGGMPEPKPQFMQKLIEEVKTTPNSVGFANDGDGDRFGVINENGEYVTPNEIMAILLLHLVKNKNMQGCLVKTVAGSLMLDKIAEKLNIKVIETAVGFKHVGEAMRKYDCIIGGEDSGGLSIKGHIPEKDGILANLLILEAMAYENKPLKELQKEIEEFTQCKFLNDRVDLKLNSTEEIAKIIDKFDNLEESCGIKILDKDKKDGIRLSFEDKNSRILVRPSGTEPLLRIYIETDNSDKMNNFKNAVTNL